MSVVVRFVAGEVLLLLHKWPSRPYSGDMKLKELDNYFRELLDIGSFSKMDASLNGVQVGDLGAEIKKVAFAVDGCAESFRRAAEAGADCLFVHHGLFWGRPSAIAGGMYDRIKILFEGNVALYAAHLPLDQNDQVGNNIAIARQLELQDVEPFGVYNGVKIGYKGRFSSPKNLDEVLRTLGVTRDECLSVLPFKEGDISTVGIISGGAATDVHQALAEEVDLYITGEVSHQIYHYCLEGQINFVAAGHYFTETFGVRELAKRLRADKGIETEFIDLPTGL